MRLRESIMHGMMDKPQKPIFTAQIRAMNNTRRCLAINDEWKEFKKKKRSKSTNRSWKKQRKKNLTKAELKRKKEEKKSKAKNYESEGT